MADLDELTSDADELAGREIDHQRAEGANTWKSWARDALQGSAGSAHCWSKKAQGWTPHRVLKDKSWSSKLRPFMLVRPSGGGGFGAPPMLN
ncbi:MAG: hypothetical protein ACKPKO_18160, partial [Candidatus Fonsibacter sp.]